MNAGVVIFDHVSAGLSQLDRDMILSVPPGGNWTHIPHTIPSRRLDQIRAMAQERGGVVRTTYYGRLRNDRPSYTISTYFNRPGNGCNVHPTQHRTLSIREAARLQSFPDFVKFSGSQASRRKQVGNAVPVLLGRAIGSIFPPCRVIDVFAGAGGLSLGLALAGHDISLATDNDSDCLQVHASVHRNTEHILGDIDDRKVRQRIKQVRDVDLLAGGPPCQGWSFGGWHDRNDSRNKYVWSFIELLQDVRPRWFIMENVQGLMWMAKGAALNSIVEEMRRTYRVTPVVLNAANYGCPQLRNRLVLIGARSGDPPTAPAPLFSDRDLFLPPYITVGDAISDLPQIEAGGGADEMTFESTVSPISNYAKWCRGHTDFATMYSHLKAQAVQRCENGSRSV